MERESALVTESVEGFAARVLRGGGVVLPLIEEGPGLLAFEAVVMEADAVHLDQGGTFLAPEQARLPRGQLLEFADAAVHALDDARGFEFGGQCFNHDLADGLGIHGLGKNLDREHVVVAIDDEARQKISLAEDDTVGVGIRDELLAVGDGGTNAIGDQGRQVGDFIARDHADRDLRRAAVEGRAQELAAEIEDPDD